MNTDYLFVGLKMAKVYTKRSPNFNIVMLYFIKWKSFTVLRSCNKYQKKLFRLLEKNLNKCNKHILVHYYLPLFLTLVNHGT